MSRKRHIVVGLAVVATAGEMLACPEVERMCSIYDTLLAQAKDSPAANTKQATQVQRLVAAVQELVEAHRAMAVEATGTKPGCVWVPGGDA